MSSELDRVLGYVVNDNDVDFDGVFLACTFLRNKLKTGLPVIQKNLASRWPQNKSIDWYEDPIRGFVSFYTLNRL